MANGDWWDRLEIDPGSPVAPFEQVRRRVIEAIRDGQVAPGSRLPTVRSLADSLGLAPNTVARSYRELEQDDVIVTKGRAGSFVATTGDVTERKAQEAARAYALRASELGIEPARALDIVRAALNG
jgi:DNA-binding transcriptional regulator YhcF (GntR family)